MGRGGGVDSFLEAVRRGGGSSTGELIDMTSGSVCMVVGGGGNRRKDWERSSLGLAAAVAIWYFDLIRAAGVKPDPELREAVSYGSFVAERERACMVECDEEDWGTRESVSCLFFNQPRKRKREEELDFEGKEGGVRLRDKGRG